MTSNSMAMSSTTQLRPNAMAASRMALPSVVPATVVSPADTLPGARCDDQGHDRPRRDDQNDGDEEKSGEQFPVHDSNRYPPFSSPSSLIRSTETTRSASAVSNTITPWVERPAMRIPSTRVRMSWPPSVTSMSWSWSSTGNEAITRPVVLVSAMATIPLPPRPVVRYSYDEERLPKPRSETVSTNCSASDSST